MLDAFTPSKEEKNDLLADAAGENVYAECAEDFILPDYLPEIRKLVRVDALPVSTGHFVGSEEVEWAGQVRYTLLYTDSEGKLASVPLHTDYSYRVAHSGTPLSIVYHECVEGLWCRPAGPRKVSIRCRICAKPHLYTESEGQKPLSLLLPEGVTPEALPYSTQRARVTSLLSDEYNEDTVFEWEGKKADTLQVMSKDAAVYIEGLRAEKGKVLCRGSLHLSLLVSDGASLFPQSRRLPFEVELSEEGVLSGDSLLAEGYVRSIECDLADSESGAVLTVSPAYVIMAEAWRNEPLTLYTDAYAAGYSLTLSSKVKSSLCFVGAARNSFTVSGETAAHGEEGARVPLSAKLLPGAVTLSLSGNQVVVSGECKASVLLECREGEGAGCVEEESFLFPFRLSLTMPEALYDTDEVEFVLRPLFASAKQEKGQLSVVGEMSLSARALRRESISVPEKIDAEPLSQEQKKEIRIYYPTPKDSLWSVGKRYNMPLAALLAANDMPKELLAEADNTKSLDGMAWLLVRAV